MRSHPATEVLGREECWALLGVTSVGRLAVDIAGQPDIFPINFIVDGDSIVFRTGAGTKLAGAVLSRYVALEIDGGNPDERTVWSVVVKGVAREIDKMEERYRADDLPLFPWVVSPKPNFVRITPSLVTGRRFHIVNEAHMVPLIGDAPRRHRGESGLGVRPDPALEDHPGAPRLRPD